MSVNDFKSLALEPELVVLVGTEIEHKRLAGARTHSHACTLAIQETTNS
jgi:hypothetical protein